MDKKPPILEGWRTNVLNNNVLNSLVVVGCSRSGRGATAEHLQTGSDGEQGWWWHGSVLTGSVVRWA